MFKKLTIICAIIALFGLQPGFAAAEGESGQDISVTVIPGDTQETELPTSHVHIYPTSNAEAVDEHGNAIPINNDGFFDFHIDMSVATIDLPVLDLDHGDDITYTDTAIQVVIVDNKLTIPLVDAKGVVTLKITADVEMVVVSGQNSRVKASNVQISSVDLLANFTQDNAKVGHVKATFAAELIAIDEGKQVSVITKVDDVAPTEEIRRAIAQIFEEEGKTTEAAYYLTVDKTNLDNNKNIGKAHITMNIDVQWLVGKSTADIKIYRWTDEGEDAGASELDTTYMGKVGGKGLFVADSPDGLSTFALAYTKPKPPFNFILPLSIGIGSIIVFGILTFLILRRRRRKEEMLTSQWPTGLKPEDWDNLE